MTAFTPLFRGSVAAVSRETPAEAMTLTVFVGYVDPVAFDQRDGIGDRSGGWNGGSR